MLQGLALVSIPYQYSVGSDTRVALVIVTQTQAVPIAMSVLAVQIRGRERMEMRRRRLGGIVCCLSIDDLGGGMDGADELRPRWS